MAVYKDDAGRALERARAARDLYEKVTALEDAVGALTAELGYVLGHLGPENFTEQGLKRMREEE